MHFTKPPRNSCQETDKCSEIVLEVGFPPRNKSVAVIKVQETYGIRSSSMAAGTSSTCKAWCINASWPKQGDPVKQKTWIGRKHVNWTKIGRFVNFAKVGGTYKEKLIKFIETGGIFNVHHWLKGVDAPEWESIKCLPHISSPDYVLASKVMLQWHWPLYYA